MEKKALLTASQLCLNYIGQPILDHVDVTIHSGDRLCLVGRNGVGKSTLIHILQRMQIPDSGTVHLPPDVHTAHLAQEIRKEDMEGTVYALVASGLGLQGESLTAYQQQMAALDRGQSRGYQALEAAQQEVERHNGWGADQKIQEMLTRLKLDGTALTSGLSSGVLRRVLLAKALVGNPDILFLDEPTNHLDMQSIQWLEDYLLRHVPTLVFVSHDRAFVRRLANGILELDRGTLARWACDYDTYAQRKDAALASEQQEWRRQDQRLAEEETWLRKGLKARRKRNMGRVRALEQLRRECRQRRQREGQAQMAIQEARRSGRVVVEAENISLGHDQQASLVSDFSLVIQRGDKVGIVGPNGCGKTTLLQGLLGQLAPQKGAVRLGTNLHIAYSDQMRETLPPEIPARKIVAGGNDFLDAGGSRQHVVSYLRDFLFTPERAQVPSKLLSGGERNRLLLAVLFSKPANVLVLDEPTNDLDSETLELLEAKLVEFAGTVLVVSHDRQFLENVVSSTLVFQDKGQVVEYAGAVPDWGQLGDESGPESRLKTRKKTPAAKKEPKARPMRLTFAQARELERLPEEIEAREEELAGLHEAMAAEGFYRQEGSAITAAISRLESLQAEIKAAYERWEELESLCQKQEASLTAKN
ncbi:MAG: ATP-binding cassette domain-containing protein [Desulfovermiculus sp.]|nr:ATP-binding cassette domain-containing protein [Desulfovermiculus sp.]